MDFEMKGEDANNDPNQFLMADEDEDEAWDETNVDEGEAWDKTNEEKINRIRAEKEFDPELPTPETHGLKWKKNVIIQKDFNIKKDILKKLGYNVKETNGPKSEKFLKDLQVIEKTGKVTGLSLNGSKIIVVDKKTGNYRLSLNASKAIIEFNHDIAVCEHERQMVITKQDLIVSKAGGGIKGGEDVFSEVNDTLQNEIDLEVERWKNDAVGVVSEEYLRDFNGIRVSSNIEGLRVEVETWTQRSLMETDPVKKELFTRAADLANTRIEQLNMEQGNLYSEEFFETHENVTLTYEKFKQWALKNLGALAAVGITIGGIIVTIVLSGKKVIITGAKGTAKLATAVKNVGKILAKGLGAIGPAVASVFSFLATVLSWGASGLVFLTNNLWLVAVALIGLLMGWKKR